MILYRVLSTMVLINPDDSHNQNSEVLQENVNIKVPKRVLHFSDGVLEEYSDDDDDETDGRAIDGSSKNSEAEIQLVNPAELAWGPWLSYKAWWAGTVTLSALDTAGEALASFFGITTPKYYFEVEEYKRREELRKKEEEEAKGWSTMGDETATHLSQVTSTKQPKSEEV